MLFKSYIKIVSIVCCIFVICSCTNNKKVLDVDNNRDNKHVENIIDTKEEKVIAYKESKNNMSIVFSGDMLMHTKLVDSIKISNQYRFERLFKDIEKEFDDIDFHIANVETTINHSKGVSGYPAFNSPEEILEALKDIKVNALIGSHNHILDTGFDGMKSTLKALEESGISKIGVGMPNEDKSLSLEKDKIKAGILAYTYGTNLGQAHGDYINYIDKEKIKKDIDALKSNEHNFIIVYLHMGTEYVRDVEKDQQELIDYIVDLGADAIICSHAHVPRKSEIINKNGKDVYVNYGMGNFISNQNDPYTNIGTISKLIIKEDNGAVYLDSAESIPVYRLRYGEEENMVYKAILVENLGLYDDVVGENEIEFIKKVAQDLNLEYNSLKGK